MGKLPHSIWSVKYAATRCSRKSGAINSIESGPTDIEANIITPCNFTADKVIEFVKSKEKADLIGFKEIKLIGFGEVISDLP